jgi:signal transduction histidine kinase
LAEEEVNLDEAREVFDDIGTAAKRASDVIAHIRELLVNHTTERERLGVNELLQESMQLVNSNLAERTVQLNVNSDPNLPFVLGDRVELQQVLINLLLNAANAIDNARSGPRTITVHASQRDNDVQIAVQDTGVGFKIDQNINRVFDAFFTTKSDGIGMGLAITKSIVEAHGGSVWAERNPEGGAIFTLTIPVAPEHDS